MIILTFLLYSNFKVSTIITQTQGCTPSLVLLLIVTYIHIKLFYLKSIAEISKPIRYLRGTQIAEWKKFKLISHIEPTFGKCVYDTYAI